MLMKCDGWMEGRKKEGKQGGRKVGWIKISDQYSEKFSHSLNSPRINALFLLGM